jgi:putative PIN family toxin of toxin-antitoxin system
MSDRAVFDCMTFLQAAMRATGPAAACFRLVDRGIVQLCVSSDVLAEIKDVLFRPSLQRRYKTLAPAKVEKFMADVEAKCLLIAEVPAVLSYARDPKDEPYVNLAVTAGARYLVTRDKDLLDLMNEETPEGKDFRQRFPGLTILDPVTFLREFTTQEQGTAPAEGEAG